MNYLILPLHPPTPSRWRLFASRASEEITPLRMAFFVGIAAVMVIESVWSFQWTGHPPCELCLLERWPYYAAIPISALICLALKRDLRQQARFGFALVGLVFIGSTIFASYHAGVEWHLWHGPSTCSGSHDLDFSVQDLLTQLKTAVVVPCDVPSVVIWGLSLSAWNAVVSAGLATLAVAAAFKKQPTTSVNVGATLGERS